MEVISKVTKASNITAGKAVQYNRLFLGTSSSKCAVEECLYIRVHDNIVRLSGSMSPDIDAVVHAVVSEVHFTDLRYVKARLEVIEVAE